MTPKSIKTSDKIAIAVFAFMALGCYLRLFVSIGLTGFMDEQYWDVASAQSALGGTPFITDLHIQQLCGLLYEPFVFIYYKLFGSTGLMLFIRHIFFALAATGSYVFYRFYRDRNSLPVTLAIAAIPLVGPMWGQPAPGYNVIGGIGYACGALIALRGFEKNKLSYWLASGFFFFLSAGAYPTLIALVAFFWIAVAVSRACLKQPWVKPFLIANSVTAGCLLLFVGELVLRAGLDNVLFGYTFSTSHSSLGDPFIKFKIGYNLFIGFIPPLWLVFSLYAVWIFLWWKKDLSWLYFAIPVSLITAFKEPPEPGPFFPPLLVLLALSSTPILVRALREDKEKNWPEFVLWLSSIAGSALTGWSSALTIYVTFVTNNYSLAPILTLVAPKNKSAGLALATLIFPVILFFHKNVIGQLDDPHAGGDQVFMTSGPYAGILTSTERQKFFLDLENDLEATTHGAKSILFYDEFPMGYLMTTLKPATFSFFMHGLRESYNVRPYYQKYYSNPENRPDIIVRFNYFVIDGNKNSVHPDQYLPYQDVFWRYLPEESHEYTLIKEREAYSIFKRQPAAQP